MTEEEDSKELVLITQLGQLASDLEMSLTVIRTALERTAPDETPAFMEVMERKVAELRDIRGELSKMLL